MKFIFLSAGFFIASLLQGLIVYMGKKIGFSEFDIQFTLFRVIHHVVVGQISGYVLLWLLSRMKKVGGVRTIFLGGLFGIPFWIVLIVIGEKSGLIQPDWLQFGGAITTLVAFIVYGLVAGFTISHWGKSNGRLERNSNH